MDHDHVPCTNKNENSEATPPSLDQAGTGGSHTDPDSTPVLVEEERDVNEGTETLCGSQRDSQGL